MRPIPLKIQHCRTTARESTSSLLLLLVPCGQQPAAYDTVHNSDVTEGGAAFVCRGLWIHMRSIEVTTYLYMDECIKLGFLHTPVVKMCDCVHVCVHMCVLMHMH